jgi:hypothetical protein
MAHGDPPRSPYIYVGGDYLYDPAADPDPTRPGHAVQVTVTFDDATRALTGAVVWRAADCLWTRIVVGVGVDGAPDRAARVFDLSGLNDATRAVTARDMARDPWNVTTIEEFMAAGQITAVL